MCWSVCYAHADETVKEGMMLDTCTIWVCQSCMLHHANGECGSCHTDEGHDREPWAIEDDQSKVTMGMVWDQHNGNCHNFSEGTAANWPCDCEIDTFSWSPCHGCGSTLGGERHAFTVWFEED